MIRHRLLVLALLIGAIVLFFAFDLGRFLDFAYLKSQHQALLDYRAANPLLSAGVYFVVYVVVTALSLPGAVPLSLIGAAVFGFWWGVLIISFASSLGATLAMLVSRYLLRDLVRSRFRRRVDAIDEGLERDGPFYLFTLRLVPLFPFFAINLAFGLTAMRASTFYWVSQLGMLAGTMVYVNAGTQLAKLDSLSGILAPGLLLSFVLLGIFPLLARRVVALIRARRVYAGWQRPRRFEQNLVVIGAGAGGLVSAYLAAAVRAKVVLIEAGEMGGDCLNSGCVPSKALIRTAKFAHQAQQAERLGIREAELRFDFAEVMARVRRVVAAIAPHDSVERYTELGVEVVRGRARITSPWSVEVNGREITTRSIIVASGACPFVPPLPGLDEVNTLTSDTLWGLERLPERLVVLGGGPIGCELAQSFARLGSEVVQVERGERVLKMEDAEVSERVAAALRADGVELLTGHDAVRCERDGEVQRLLLEHADGERVVEFDALLVAVGRVANTEGFGLEELGIPLSPRKTIETDAWLQTLYPNIYACGDVAGPYQFTHTAAHQAWYASVNALFGGFKRFRADYSVIPWVTFTDPEVAHVGLDEQQAGGQGIPYEVTRYDLADLDRAITDESAHGFVKVLTEPGRDRILGVTIVGSNAGEMLAEFTLAMRHGLGLNKILGTIHPYPTFCEANKYAAGSWKRAHAPERLLRAVERLHAWRRGA